MGQIEPRKGNVMQQSNLSEDDLLPVFAVAYCVVKRSERQPKINDRLIEDLGLDSLDTIDVLFQVEENTGIRLSNVTGSEFDQVATVGDLLHVVSRHLASA
jgi:acyl carrier protein